MADSIAPITRPVPDASVAAAARAERDRLSQSLRELRLLVQEAHRLDAISATAEAGLTRLLTAQESGGPTPYDLMVDETTIDACSELLFVTTATGTDAAGSPVIGTVCTLATLPSHAGALLIWILAGELPAGAAAAANQRLKTRPVLLASHDPAWLTGIDLPMCEKLTIASAPACLQDHLRQAQALAEQHGPALMERCALPSPVLPLAPAIGAELAQRLSTRRRFIQTRLNAATLESEAADSTRNDASARQQADSLRSAIESKADEVMSGAQAVIAEWFGARGKLNQLVLSHVQNLGDEDFDTDESYSKLVRRLNPRIGSELKIKLQESAKDLFRAAAQASRDAVALLEQDCFARCRPLGMDEMSYRALPIDEDRAWMTLKAQIEVPVDIKFEMHRRGIFKRLSEGKQVMATTMMSLGLIGMVAGFQWRQNTTILYALPVIFVAGFVYSFYSWKQEDRETIAKELERVRDTMTRELNRSLSESERLIVEFVRRAINDTAKHLLGHIDRVMKQTAAKQASEVADRRNRLRDQMRRLETDLRAIDALLSKARAIRA